MTREVKNLAGAASRCSDVAALAHASHRGHGMVSQDGIWMISPHAEHDRQKDVHVGQPLETSRAEQQPLLESSALARIVL